MRIQSLLLFFVLVGSSWSLPAFAQNLSLSSPLGGVDRGLVSVPFAELALEPFEAASALAEDYSARLYAQIELNLAGVGLLSRIHLAEPLANAMVDHVMDRSLRQSLNSENLENLRARAVARVAPLGSHSFLVALTVEDRREGLNLSSYAVRAHVDNWMRVANALSDEIYQSVTGQPGHFDTQIAFVGPVEDGSALWVANQDGSGIRLLFAQAQTLSDPRFVDSSQLVVLSRDPGALESDLTRVLLVNTRTGEMDELVTLEGLVGVPQFAPTGAHMVMSLEREGDADLYLLNLTDGHLTRLNAHPAHDVAPQFAPDGQTVLFVSDRSGTRQLHQLSLIENAVQRLSFAGGTYSVPAWSPDSAWVAFVKESQDVVHLGVLNPELGEEHILATASGFGAPSWSPNGRFLLYTKVNADSQAVGPIHVFDLATLREQALSELPEASGVTWSPARSR